MRGEAYTELIELLDGHRARYRFIDHAPEGRTEAVSAVRGNDLGAAAKCMILMVKRGKKETAFVLAVVPGDKRVSFAAVKRLFDATYVSIAPVEVAERLAGSVSGTILPFAFDDRLQVVVDPGLRTYSEIYFNAGRLDRSVVLATEDYFAIVTPQIATIVDQQVS